MSEQILELLAKKYNEEIQHLEQEIGKGMCRDYGEYKAATGTVLGFKKANAIVQEMHTALIGEEDD